MYERQSRTNEQNLHFIEKTGAAILIIEWLNDRGLDLVP